MTLFKNTVCSSPCTLLISMPQRQYLPSLPQSSRLPRTLRPSNPPPPPCFGHWQPRQLSEHWFPVSVYARLLGRGTTHHYLKASKLSTKSHWPNTPGRRTPALCFEPRQSLAPALIPALQLDILTFFFFKWLSFTCSPSLWLLEEE